MQILLSDLAGAASTAHMLRQLDFHGPVNRQMLSCALADILLLEERAGAGFDRVTYTVAQPDAAPHNFFAITQLFWIHGLLLS
jgi:hypothetical protein